MNLPLKSQANLCLWKFTSNGLFSTISAYRFLTQSTTKAANYSLATGSKWVYKNIFALAKIKVFIWLANLDRISNNFTLFKRKIINSPSCLLCDEPENTFHILRKCTTAQRFLSFFNPLVSRSFSNFCNFDLQSWLKENCSSDIDLSSLVPFGEPSFPMHVGLCGSNIIPTHTSPPPNL